MGIIGAGILGGFRKKVGNIVGARYKGIDYIRLRVTPTMSQEAGPVAARANMKTVMSLARFNNETIIKRTFGPAVKGKSLSPINRFVQKALKDRDPVADYANIPWSEGVVTKPVITNAEYDTFTNTLYFDMPDSVSGYGSMDDECLVFVSNIDDPTAEIVSDGDSRTVTQSTYGPDSTGMYKILSSKKTGGSSAGKTYVHVVCFNSKGEVSETGTALVSMVSSET